MWPTYGLALAGGEGGATIVNPELPIEVEVDDVAIEVEVDTS